MENPARCKCGSNTFWFMGTHVKCKHCKSKLRYFQYGHGCLIKEIWYLKYNKTSKTYNKKWEQLKPRKNKNERIKTI